MSGFLEIFQSVAHRVAHRVAHSPSGGIFVSKCHPSSKLRGTSKCHPTTKCHTKCHTINTLKNHRYLSLVALGYTSFLFMPLISQKGKYKYAHYMREYRAEKCHPCSLRFVVGCRP